MDEPKRYDAVDGDGYHAWKCVEAADGDFYKADDPAIVQALAVRKECHEAGLLDEHGNLRRIVGRLAFTADGAIALPSAFVYLADGTSLLLPGCCGTSPPIPNSLGRCVVLSDCYSTREASERAAKGGTDAT